MSFHRSRIRLTVIREHLHFSPVISFLQATHCPVKWHFTRVIFHQLCQLSSSPPLVLQPRKRSVASSSKRLQADTTRVPSRLLRLRSSLVRDPLFGINSTLQSRPTQPRPRLVFINRDSENFSAHLHRERLSRLWTLISYLDTGTLIRTLLTLIGWHFFSRACFY